MILLLRLVKAKNVDRRIILLCLLREMTGSWGIPRGIQFVRISEALCDRFPRRIRRLPRFVPKDPTVLATRRSKCRSSGTRGQIETTEPGIFDQRRSSIGCSGVIPMMNNWETSSEKFLPHQRYFIKLAKEYWALNFFSCDIASDIEWPYEIVCDASSDNFFKQL